MGVFISNQMMVQRYMSVSSSVKAQRFHLNITVYSFFIKIQRCIFLNFIVSKMYLCIIG